MRFLLSFLAVAGIVLGVWFFGEAIGIDLALVPSLILALLLTAALHVTLNRPRRRS